MISYYAKRSSGEEFEKLTTPLSEGVWVYGEAVTSGELDALVKQFSLDKNIVVDLKDEHELPRVEFSDDKEYVFLRVPRRSKRGNVTTSPLLAIVNHTNYFTLSAHAAGLPREQIASSAPLHGGTHAALLLGTIAALVAQYEALILHTSRIVKDTGRRLRTHAVTNKDFIHFVTVEDNLNEYRMNLGGMLAVTKRLRENNHQIFNETDHESIEDISLHIQQLLVAVESYSQSVDSIRNAYSTVANNTMNERIKTLTVFTVLITLPNVFFGMYGMNVLLPFADQSWAYAAVVTVTIGLIFVVYGLAKRFKVF